MSAAATESPAPHDDGGLTTRMLLAILAMTLVCVLGLVACAA